VPIHVRIDDDGHSVRRRVRLRDGVHDAVIEHVIGHRQDEGLGEALTSGQNRPDEAVLPAGIVNDVELDTEVRAFPERPSYLGAAVTDDDHGALDSGARELPEQSNDHGLTADFDQGLGCTGAVESSASSGCGYQS
jgi:hypothetical protein